MTQALTFETEAAVDDFVRRFRECSLPKREWTHQAHLVVGLWHVLENPDNALDLLREGIRRYNEHTGTPNTDEGGYHETWTVFFVHALAAYAAHRTPQNRLSLLNGLPASRLADKMLTLVCYSRDRMMSVAARKSRIEPDVQPLEELRNLLNPATMDRTSFYLRPAARSDAAGLLRLIIALAEFEKLPPPDEPAQRRLIEDSFGPRPRIEPWLAFADGTHEPVGYAIFLETYSSFLARPTFYIEDVFVLDGFRKQGIGGALLRQAVALAHQRGCGRIEWTALDWNVNAQQVYEQRMGARRMSEWLLYRMTREDMERYLEPS